MQKHILQFGSVSLSSVQFIADELIAGGWGINNSDCQVIPELDCTARDTGQGRPLHCCFTADMELTKFSFDILDINAQN